MRARQNSPLTNSSHKLKPNAMVGQFRELLFDCQSLEDSWRSLRRTDKMSTMDEDRVSSEERLNNAVKPKNQPQPGPAKNVGDDSPNPLPTDHSESDGGHGGDVGRT